MKINKRAKYKVLNVVFCSLFLMSCGSEKEDAVSSTIDLNKGAIVELKEGLYENYNLQDGEYNKVDSDKSIRLYDKESGNYIGEKDNKLVYSYNGKLNELNNYDSSDSNLKLAPKGKYISYFSNGEGLKLHLVDLKENEEIEFNSKVLISGTFLDWLDEENVVYYGVSEDGLNGIFQYNVKSKEEKLFYKIDGGFIHFIKNVESGVICIQETINNEKIVRLLDKDGNDKEILSESLSNAYDVIYDGKVYYFLGKANNNVVSIYRLENKTLKRLVYDFPKNIDVNKGLSLDEENNVLFIGSNLDNNKEEIYKIEKDDSVNLIKSDSTDYSFVKYQ